MTQASGENVLNIDISYSATLLGSYTALGGVMGDVKLPEKTTAVQKFQPNDADVPAAMLGKDEMSDLEIVVAYADHATYAILAALQRTTQYFKFTFEGGDSFTYQCVVSKVAPCNGSDNGGAVGALGLSVLELAAASAAT